MVIDRLLVRVDKDAVSLGGFLEPLLGLLTPGIPVGVVLKRCLPVSLFDLFRLGSPGNSEDLVIILSSHFPYFLRSTALSFSMIFAMSADDRPEEALTWILC